MLRFGFWELCIEKFRSGFKKYADACFGVTFPHLQKVFPRQFHFTSRWVCYKKSVFSDFIKHYEVTLIPIKNRRQWHIIQPFRADLNSI